jgi:hypothetical protein
MPGQSGFDLYRFLYIFFCGPEIYDTSPQAVFFVDDGIGQKDFPALLQLIQQCFIELVQAGFVASCVIGHISQRGDAQMLCYRLQLRMFLCQFE